MLDTLQFSLTEMTIPANTDVVVNAINVGSAPHSFVVEGQGIGTAQLSGGQSRVRDDQLAARHVHLHL
jgi:hypothetical protein